MLTSFLLPAVLCILSLVSNAPHPKIRDITSSYVFASLLPRWFSEHLFLVVGGRAQAALIKQYVQ